MFTPHTLTAPPLALSLLPYGLTFHSLKVQVAPTDNCDLLVGYEDPKDHDCNGTGRGRGFINQTVGRYANRLPTSSKYGNVDLVLPGSDGQHVGLVDQGRS